MKPARGILRAEDYEGSVGSNNKDQGGHSSKAEVSLNMKIRRWNGLEFLFKYIDKEFDYLGSLSKRVRNAKKEHEL